LSGNDGFFRLRRQLRYQTVAPIDRFERDWVSWITLGGMKLNLRTKDNPLGERALEASYRQSETALPVLVRRVERLESRLRLIEEEARGGIDLKRFMGPEKNSEPGTENAE